MVFEYIFYYNLSDGNVNTYNYTTKKFKEIAYSEVLKLKRHYSLPIGMEKTNEVLKQFADDFFPWIEELKNNDIFSIDYLKYKSHDTACIQLFKQLCNGKYEDIEEIDPIEYEFIESCNNFGLLYCEQGKYDCYGYDFSSQYPSIMASDLFQFPKCKGTLRTLTKLHIVDGKIKNIQDGMYKVKITSDDYRFKKIFGFSRKNVYTHTSLFFAMYCIREEGYDVKIELINEMINCYIYDKKDIVSGCTVFSYWHKMLFQLKEKFPKNKLIKLVTSSLWGRLTQHNKKYKSDDEIIDEDLDVALNYDRNHDYYIRDSKLNGKGIEINELVNCRKPYYYNLARMKPFLLAKAREITGRVGLQYIDDVVRICIDNVTFNKQHDDVMYNKRKIKLIKETKTSGIIKWRNARCYKNFTTGYQSKHFKDEIADEDD
jgi:hypothetical protein